MSDQQVQASHKLEELAVTAKEIVKLLRDGQKPPIAYALVYALRAELSHIVRDLGAGTPSAHQADQASLLLVQASIKKREV